MGRRVRSPLGRHPAWADEADAVCGWM